VKRAGLENLPKISLPLVILQKNAALHLNFELKSEMNDSIKKIKTIRCFLTGLDLSIQAKEGP
jgi:hypothetical protein